MPSLKLSFNFKKTKKSVGEEGNKKLFFLPPSSYLTPLQNKKNLLHPSIVLIHFNSILSSFINFSFRSNDGDETLNEEGRKEVDNDDNSAVSHDIITILINC